MIDVPERFLGDKGSVVGLSPDGEERRLKILALAQDAARGRRRRRIATRVIAACIVVFCGVIPLAARFSHRNSSPSRSQIAERRQPSAPSDVAPRHRNPQQHPNEIVVTRIETDPEIANRLAVRREAPVYRRLTDDDLLRQLADAGRPAGIAYVRGHATLLYHGRMGAADGPR